MEALTEARRGMMFQYIEDNTPNSQTMFLMFGLACHPVYGCWMDITAAADEDDAQIILADWMDENPVEEVLAQ